MADDMPLVSRAPVQDGRDDARALRNAGTAYLQARDYPRAIEALARAETLSPDHDATRLALATALQGARRHEEALDWLERVSPQAPERGAARMHAAYSLLSLGRALAARGAAREATALLPRSASAHCAVGQAELALGAARAAEAAFLAAIAIDGKAADFWALLGAARRLAGDDAGAGAALAEALRLNPKHASANAVRVRSGSRPGRDLKAWNPVDQRSALGLAVDYLSKKTAFAKLPFGEWSRTLAHQSGRGQQVFVVDAEQRILGYLGWTMTRRALAEEWLRGLRGLSDEECREGDCVIVNAWAADSKQAARVLLASARELFKDKATLYFKRFYQDGRMRPMRLPVNAFAEKHLTRSLTML